MEWRTRHLVSRRGGKVVDSGNFESNRTRSSAQKIPTHTLLGKEGDFLCCDRSINKENLAERRKRSARQSKRNRKKKRSKMKKKGSKTKRKGQKPRKIEGVDGWSRCLEIVDS